MPKYNLAINPFIQMCRLPFLIDTDSAKLRDFVHSCLSRLLVLIVVPVREVLLASALWISIAPELNFKQKVIDFKNFKKK